MDITKIWRVDLLQCPFGLWFKPLPLRCSSFNWIEILTSTHTQFTLREIWNTCLEYQLAVWNWLLLTSSTLTFWIELNKIRLTRVTCLRQIGLLLTLFASFARVSGNLPMAYLKKKKRLPGLLASFIGCLTAYLISYLPSVALVYSFYLTTLKALWTSHSFNRDSIDTAVSVRCVLLKRLGER